MPLGDLGSLPSSATASILSSSSSSTASNSDSTVSSSPTHQTTLTGYSHTSSARLGWAVNLSAALVHPSVFPLVSFASTADLVHFCLLYLPSVNSIIMPPNLRMPKSPIKASVSRHEEHSKANDHRNALDPDCAICQLPIGKKSPEGVKEGYSLLPCGHIFGSVCIKTYMSITDKPQCPICRADSFYSCTHPVHPAAYDHKKARRSPSDTASKAFFPEFRLVSCHYCRKRQARVMKRARRREMLEAARAAAISGSADSSSSSSTASSAGGSGSGTAASVTDGEESPVSVRAKKATRWALHTASHTVHMTIALARLTLDAAGIRKIKTLHHHRAGELDSEQDVSGSSSSEEDEDNEDENVDEDVDENDDEGSVASDSPVTESPVSPPLHANRSDLPPVPGPYGHWDLAKKERDWKFLTWYNGQEPKINPPREHYS